MKAQRKEQLMVRAVHVSQVGGAGVWGWLEKCWLPKLSKVSSRLHGSRCLQSQVHFAVFSGSSGLILFCTVPNLKFLNSFSYHLANFV